MLSALPALRIWTMKAKLGSSLWVPETLAASDWEEASSWMSVSGKCFVRTEVPSRRSPCRTWKK